MSRIRAIKKYGNTYIIPLTSIDMKDFELKEGDRFDIETMLVAGKIKQREKRKK